MKRYWFRVDATTEPHVLTRFHIVIEAETDASAQAQAAAIGLTLNLMLLGPL